MVLIIEVSFFIEIFELTEHILLEMSTEKTFNLHSGESRLKKKQKQPSEVFYKKGVLKTATTTIQRVYRILEIVFKFVPIQMTKPNSRTRKKFYVGFVVACL